MFPSRSGANPGAYPAVPDSLREASFEMHEMRKVQDARADTAPSVTPYLSLQSRLSQIWINRWTVLLLLVLVQVLLTITDLTSHVDDAKSKALSACTKVEEIGSSMASMPHYLSVGVNELTATGIDKAVAAMIFMLDLIISGVEGMILFYINFLTATYVCLITAMVHGSLDVVADVTKDASKALNSLINGTVKEIKDISGGLENGINSITSSIEKSVFGKTLPDIPKVDFTKPIDKLQAFKLDPSDFVKDVRKLDKDLPDFDQVQNLTKEAISIPFNLVRDALNQKYGNYTFDRNAFPLAKKEKMSFCSNNNDINDFFVHLGDLIHKARVIFIVVLIILAILAMFPMAWLEMMRWRRQQRHARLIAQNQYDPMDVVYIASRSTTASAGIKVASRFTGKRQILVRWCVAYATSPAALFILSLALAGFFSCFCHWLMIKAITKEVPELTNKVGAFAEEVVQSLANVSESWGNDANHVVKGMNDDINHDVLGYVTNATDAVNKTINTFVDTMNEGLNDVFKGTVLLDPIKTVLHCVIGIKIESVQRGLTWVHDNAKVDFPMFDTDVFSLGAKDSVGKDSDLNTFLSSPSSATTDEVSGAVEDVVNWLHNNLVTNALTSLGILLVYIVVVLFGVARTLAGMASPDRGRAEGGMRYAGEERPGYSPRSMQPEFDGGQGTRFPRFGSSSVEDENYVRGVSGGDEKMMSGAYGAQPAEHEGHQRNSSYGHFEPSGKY